MGRRGKEVNYELRIMNYELREEKIEGLKLNFLRIERKNHLNI